MVGGHHIILTVGVLFQRRSSLGGTHGYYMYGKSQLHAINYAINVGPAGGGKRSAARRRVPGTRRRSRSTTVMLPILDVPLVTA